MSMSELVALPPHIHNVPTPASSNLFLMRCQNRLPQIVTVSTHPLVPGPPSYGDDLSCSQHPANSKVKVVNVQNSLETNLFRKKSVPYMLCTHQSHHRRQGGLKNDSWFSVPVDKYPNTEGSFISIVHQVWTIYSRI